MTRAELLTGPERQQRWSEDEKAAILAELAKRGASGAAVARRFGVNRSLARVCIYDRQHANLPAKHELVVNYSPSALLFNSLSDLRNGGFSAHRHRDRDKDETDETDPAEQHVRRPRVRGQRAKVKSIQIFPAFSTSMYFLTKGSHLHPLLHANSMKVRTSLFTRP